MIKHFLSLTLLCLLIGALGLTNISCESENLEDLMEETEETEVSYANDIEPLLRRECGDCHGGGINLGDIDLSNIEGVREVGNTSQLVGSIKHEEGYANMPQDREQLPEDEIELIKTWVDEGMPDN